MDSNDRREYEFIMEGITTRMQIALEKQSASTKWVCVTALIAILLIIAGFVTNNVIMIHHINDIRGEMISEAVSADEEVSQLRTRPAD